MIEKASNQYTDIYWDTYEKFIFKVPNMINDLRPDVQTSFPLVFLQ